jgi:hypothetical protein
LELEDLARTALPLLSIAAITSLFGLLFWWSIGTENSSREEHSGLIMGKQIRLAESEEGSFLVNYLLIQKPGGEQKWLRVTESIYRHAEVGMKLKIGNGKTELVSPPSTIRIAR